jgi:hypothetical protein
VSSDLLERIMQGGDAVAALDLHVRALLAARDGDLDTALTSLDAAQQWETSNGYSRAALHTSHQRALTMNFNGDLARLRKYYEETLGTLKRLRNREGAALCLRSVGELALVQDAPAETARAWELSERLFQALGLAEAGQVAAWRQCVGLAT